MHQEDILGLEISVNQIQVVKDWKVVSIRARHSRKKQLTSHASEQLPGKALDLRTWERHETISFEEVKNTLAKQVRHYANVVPKIK